MSEFHPNNYDVILGRQNQQPVNAAVLGGLAGAQQRLNSESLFARLQALKEGINYGSDGINLAIEALSDPAEEVKKLALKLLRTQAGAEGKAVLLEREPLSYFTTLADWRYEVYNPKVGLIDPENNAYVINLNILKFDYHLNIFDLSQFEALTKDPKIGELQVLIFQIEPKGICYSFGVALEAIIDASNLFPQLRGLFIGDSTGEDHQYRNSRIDVFDIKPFLVNFPDLEILQVYGNFSNYLLECGGIKHKKLKTLIIETSDINGDNIQQIGAIDMPSLEYLKLWLGNRKNSDFNIVKELEPILSGMSTPQLKYLGLCNDGDTDSLLLELLKTEIVRQLAVLDLSMGCMTENGVDYLTSADRLSNLKLLNVSDNELSTNAINRLQKFNIMK